MSERRIVGPRVHFLSCGDEENVCYQQMLTATPQRKSSAWKDQHLPALHFLFPVERGTHTHTHTHTHTPTQHNLMDKSSSGFSPHFLLWRCKKRVTWYRRVKVAACRHCSSESPASDASQEAADTSGELQRAQLCRCFSAPETPNSRCDVESESCDPETRLMARRQQAARPHTRTLRPHCDSSSSNSN